MEQYLEIAGVIVGVVYLWLEYKASIYLWVASVVMPAIYLFVYYDAGLYADTVLNIYYLAIALYGWLAWRRGGKQDQEELPIRRATAHTWIIASAIFIVSQVAISALLITLTDSEVPWANGFTSALSVVGMWLLARKYLEQWIVWIVADVALAALYIHTELYFTAALYAIYAIIAIFGYRNWKRLIAEQNA
jgi:nicotinamide mononucleotide transporter